MAEFTKQDTFEKIAALVASKLSIDKSKVTEKASLQDLGADSLDLVEIIMKLEEQFGVEIDDEKAEQFKSVTNVVNYIHSLRTK